MLGARLQVRLLSDEVGRLDLRSRQPGLDRVVLALELGAHQAVALLDPAGHGVDTDAHRPDVELLPGLRDRVPHAEPVLHLGVDLPAVLAHVRDAEHRARHTVDQHVAHRPVREGFPFLLFFKPLSIFCTKEVVTSLSISISASFVTLKTCALK